MWSALEERLSNRRGLRISITNGSSVMTFADVLHGWRYDAAFRSFFIELLAAAPFAEFRWETPPITAASVNRPFEFVLLDSPGLAAIPEPEAFADHFPASTSNVDVVSFPNLGRDAILVVPRPIGPASCYRHLAVFLREAPERQKHSLWKIVGESMEKAIGQDARWLSTAGAGVSWLHVRIDKQPKYYGYALYRET
jgi:Family of unknown function (DUF6940)